MELLLKRDRLGEVVEGSDERLLERANHGDDITLYEESSVFSCFVVFANYAVSADRFDGLSLAHMAHGELADPEALIGSSLTTIQYIYDSKNKNLLCKDVLDDQYTLTSIWANNPHYSSLAWYTSRRYVDRHVKDSNDMKAYGAQLKVRLEFHEHFKLILKPEALYFPENGKGFTIKSAAMILPTEFALNPKEYLEDFRPLIANKAFSLGYLSIDSEHGLTLVHQQRYSADEYIDSALQRVISVSTPAAVFEARQDYRSHSLAEKTHIECDYTILVPEVRSTGRNDHKP